MGPDWEMWRIRNVSSLQIDLVYTLFVTQIKITSSLLHPI